MRMNKFLMLGIAGLAFAACNNEEDFGGNAETQGTKQVTVTIKAGSYNQTKATDDAWTTDKTITLTSAKVYLLDASNNIVGIEDATTGQNVYHNVAGTVQKIAATANVTPTTTTGSTWAALKAETFNVADFQTAANAPLFADAVTLDYSGTDNEDGNPMYSATLTMETNVSRIELSGNLQCTNMATNAYSSLQLVNVGINGANQQFTLEGTGSNPIRAQSNVDGFPVASTTPRWCYDPASGPTLTDNTAQALGSAYGYPICGGLRGTSGTLGTAGAEVILRFDSEEKAGGATPGYIVYDPAYLKIVSLQDAEGGAVTIEGGKIYQITDIVFTEEDITTLEPNQICVTATVNVVDWEIEAVEPVYGE